MAKILVIDDEDLTRITLRRMLERAGHVVVEAVNGLEGLTHYRAAPFDLVITDIIMPDKEGVETIVELVRDFPGVRIIAISGGARTRSVDFLHMATELGARRSIGKPFSQSELIAAVDAVLAAPD